MTCANSVLDIKSPPWFNAHLKALSEPPHPSHTRGETLRLQQITAQKKQKLFRAAVLLFHPKINEIKTLPFTFKHTGFNTGAIILHCTEYYLYITISSISRIEKLTSIVTLIGLKYLQICLCLSNIQPAFEEKSYNV